MSNEKHTPGPWAADDDKSGWVRSETCQNIVCIVEPDLHHKGERDANAALIAAAPEVLAMLKELNTKVHDVNGRNHAGLPPTHDDWSALFQLTCKAGGVIHKAEGK